MSTGPRPAALARSSGSRREWFETTPAGWADGPPETIDDDDTFDTFKARNAGLDRREFRARYPSPFLVLRMPGGSGSSDPRDRTLLPTELDSIEDGGSATVLIAQLCFQHSGEFQQTIAIGRTEDNDIVIRHACMSRFQAYITLDGDRACISDEGSLNGTELEGGASSPMRDVELRSGARIIFSKMVSAVFLSSGDTWAYMRGQLNRKGRV